MKKLKLKATEMQALSNVLIEAELAYALQEEHQLPVMLDEKVGALHELLTLADARTFDRTTVEDLIAYLKEAPPQELAEVCFKSSVMILLASESRITGIRYCIGAVGTVPNNLLSQHSHAVDTAALGCCIRNMLLGISTW